jgi:GNAT superfamily N-acetyltransferase
MVEDVRVERSYRGRGIGGLLLSHAEAQATELGCKLVELFVHGDRDDTHRFYERAGYTGAHRGFRKALAKA